MDFIDSPLDVDTQTSSHHSFKSSVLQFLKNSADIIVLIAVLLFIRAFIISPFMISGNSMEHTMHDGELVITNKLIYNSLLGWEFGNPERGDVVVFRPPHDRSTFYIKRIIGIPGDSIAFQGHDVLVNGVPIQEPYLRCALFVDGVEITNTCNYSRISDREPWIVPENSYFVMGDNRNESSDSRGCFERTGNCSLGVSPFVPRADIAGKAWFILWPFWQQHDKEGPTGLRFAPTHRY